MAITVKLTKFNRQPSKLLSFFYRHPSKESTTPPQAPPFPIEFREAFGNGPIIHRNIPILLFPIYSAEYCSHKLTNFFLKLVFNLMLAREKEDANRVLDMNMTYR